MFVSRLPTTNLQLDVSMIDQLNDVVSLEVLLITFQCIIRQKGVIRLRYYAITRKQTHQHPDDLGP
jgi:hypothetical protein